MTLNQITNNNAGFSPWALFHPEGQLQQEGTGFRAC